MKLTNYYEDPNQLHIGCEENRCYYVPLTKEEKASGRILSGDDWKFNYYNCMEEVEDTFCKEEFDSTDYKEITVPSCWQMIGYDQKQYTNVRYPFPYDPPYVPNMNPCGAYYKDFVLSEEEVKKEQFLYFEGVDSCFYLWVNGILIGYSEVSHSSSEFKITNATKLGKNRIAVLVLKWCAGSYLEDQDKFRYSGIFRDVNLLFRPTSYIRDFTIRTSVNYGLNDKSKNSAVVSIRLDEMIKNPSVTIELYQGKTCIDSKNVDGKTVEFIVNDPVLWNAEHPYLYTLKLITEEEVIIQKVGIRTIEIKDRKVYLNNSLVKFKGVNRHDSSPYTGATISKEDALVDLKLMKEFNINAIRTSHYPNAPWFMEYCNEFGFYVIAESDIEIHGTTSIYGEDWDENFGLLARDLRFHDAILDRVQRNVIRDKNQCCACLWSLGNEAGYGINFEDAGRWVKEYDPTRLTHYEGAWHASKKIPNSKDMLDVDSYMYPSTRFMEEHLRKPETTKPMVLCEFVHAMGNGPGDIEDYLKVIYKYDEILGGFVWEWCDHASYEGKTKEGKNIFHYGGDAGEFPHDNNFCVDGLVYPDRRPHTGLYEWKNSIRPVRASICFGIPKSNEISYGFASNIVETKENGKNKIDTIDLKFKNLFDFTNLSDYVTICYTIKREGEVLEEGTLPKLCAKPHEIISYQLMLSHGYTKEELNYAYLKLTYYKADGSYKRSESLQCIDLLQDGHELGFEQFALFEEKDKEITIDKTKGEMKLEETNTSFILASSRIHYEFDKRLGTFCIMNQDEVAKITKPINFITYRAATDNDGNIKHKWKQAGYDRGQIKVYHTEAVLNENIVTITCDFSISAVYLQPFLRLKAVWEVNGEGDIKLSLNATKDMIFPYLPRFGLEFSLPNTNQEVTYFGYGPLESYIDKCRSSYMDVFQTTVDELHEDYIKPQENGSHYNCYYVKIGDLLAEGEKPLSFNASHYCVKELSVKKHNYELVKSDCIHAIIDYKQSGIGSNSCGPALEEQYQLNEEEFVWNVKFSFKR